MTEAHEVSAIILTAIDGAYCYLPLYFQKIGGLIAFYQIRSQERLQIFDHLYGHLLAVGTHVQ